MPVEQASETMSSYPDGASTSGRLRFQRTVYPLSHFADFLAPCRGQRNSPISTIIAPGFAGRHHLI